MEKTSKFLYFVTILIKIPLYWLCSSRNRAIVYSLVNVITQLSEVIVCISHILSDVHQNFLDTPWNCLFAFFGLKVLPAVLGIALILSVLTNHGIMSHGWCILEIVAVTVSISLFLYYNPDEIEDKTIITFVLYIAYRLVGLFLVYHYLYELEFGKFDKTLCFASGRDFMKTPVGYGDYLKNHLQSLENEIFDVNTGSCTHANSNCPDIVVHKYSLRP